jgi:hypothetical protein
MKCLFEKYGDEASAKDGGFVFQAIISHDVKWEIVNGETKIDPKKINSTLHQIDVFPDIKLSEGSALSTYVMLSEVNILKRKFELASEALKKRISPEYRKEVESLKTQGLSAEQRKSLNAKYFQNTYYEASVNTNHLVLREVSTSGLDSGSPKITLKISTGMVDTLDAKPTKTWEAFTIKVDGSSDMIITNQTESIASIQEFDEIEKVNDVVFRTILPSLLLEFKGDRVAIDTLSNRSAQVAVGALTDYENLFSVSDKTVAPQSTPSAAINK